MLTHLRGTHPSSRSRWLAAPAVVAAAALALSACGSSSSTAPAGAPAPSAGAGPGAMTITLANTSGTDTCTPDRSSVPAGPVTVTVKNESAAGITELELLKDQRILGEKENLAPGLAPTSFTVTLDGGTHQIYCPGADQDHVDFMVTGQAAAAAPTGSAQSTFAQGTKDYAADVFDQINSLDTAVGELNTAVQAGNVDQAKTAYAKARPFYERAEANVEGFVLPGFKPEDNAGNLDYLVDMRESTPVDQAVGWSGLHAVERDLWQDNIITNQTKKYSTDLVANAAKLKDVVGNLQYRPEDLANGAADLIEEVQNGKITGEEEAYSHLDLLDFAANVEGAQQAYASLRPGLAQIDADLVTKLDQQFQSVQATLDGYRAPNALGGFTPYTPALKASDSAKLTAAIQPLHDSLASVAQKVA